MKYLFPNEIEFSAKFSDCGKYRYTLCRIWDKSKGIIMYIGLNPSTANSTTDDPTIRRLKIFTRDFDYGGFIILNLFALVTPYPEELWICENPIMDNDLYIEYYKDKVEKVIFCWGNFKLPVYGRDKAMIKLFPEAYCFGKNNNGSPKHPLYLKANTKLIKFNNQ